MKKEGRHLKTVRALGLAIFLFGLCLNFNSCITINQLPVHTQMNPFVDPVCGMKVDTASALKTDYNGRTYYFDSAECQKVFLKNPEKFAADHSTHQNGHNMHMGWVGGTAMIMVMVLAMTSMIIFGHWR